jgi:hypothetical protein
VRSLRADAGKSKLLCDGGHDGNGAVGRDREDAFDGLPSAELDDGADVPEVEHVAHVRRGYPRGCRIAVNGDGAETKLARSDNRSPLMAARADKEDSPQLAAIVTAGRALSVYVGKRKRTRSQRLISHPSVRLNSAEILLPRSRPRTRATCGPP